jgi:addiction module HigA family antidote
MLAASQPTAKRAEYPVRRPLRRPAVHPGVLMREILEDHLKLTIAEAARRMGISRPALYAVLNGTAAVTAEMALRFARLAGGAPELYLNMQTTYDLEAARQRLEREIEAAHQDKGTQAAAPARQRGRRRATTPKPAAGKRGLPSLGDQVLALATGMTQQEITAACKGARPNHVGVAIARHKRAGRIEERDGKLYHAADSNGATRRSLT